MPPVHPEVRTNADRKDDSSAPMQVSSGAFPTALPECAQRRKPADHVRKHPPPLAESWSRDTPFDIESTAGETTHCKVLTMDQNPTHLAISARAITGLDLQDLLGNEVFVSQDSDYAVHDLRNFPTVNKAFPLTKKHHAYHYMPALFGGRPIEQSEVIAPPITTERGVALTREQAEFAAIRSLERSLTFMPPSFCLHHSVCLPP
uniref:Uncharacterized protein n=1 Tax=Caenorhabditis japonica TaxID=281687 RepID=A0A8R1ELJ8_CAEJA